MYDAYPSGYAPYIKRCSQFQISGIGQWLELTMEFYSKFRMKKFELSLD